MRKILYFIAFLGFIFAMVAKGQAGEKTIVLTYANFFPPTHVQSQLAEAWIKEIEKRTHGQVKINYFPGGALLKGGQIYDGVLKGIVDIGMSCFAYTRGRFPSMEALDLPLGYPSGMVATLVANAFYRQFHPKELNEVKVLYLHAHGPGLLHTKKPVYRLEDLKGRKIRCTGFSAKLVKALGAVPVAMSQGQAYEALQRGVVEGTFTPMETLKGWRQAEVIKYTIDCKAVGYTTAMYVIMNKQKWESLPADIKKVFTEVSQEWIVKHGQAWDKSDAEGRAFTLSLGNKIIDLSPSETKRWVERAQLVIADYVKEMKAKGLPGEEYVKAIKKIIKENQ
jgi:TRAP-type C4-dicarboxylate transport system substrate-binding protein